MQRNADLAKLLESVTAENHHTVLGLNQQLRLVLHNYALASFVVAGVDAHSEIVLIFHLIKSKHAFIFAICNTIFLHLAKNHDGALHVVGHNVL